MFSFKPSLIMLAYSLVDLNSAVLVIVFSLYSSVFTLERSLLQQYVRNKVQFRFTFFVLMLNVSVSLSKCFKPSLIMLAYSLVDLNSAVLVIVFSPIYSSVFSISFLQSKLLQTEEVVRFSKKFKAGQQRKSHFSWQKTFCKLASFFSVVTNPVMH